MREQSLANLFNEKTRAYIYRVLVAIGLLLVGYGIISGNELTLWLGVATAVLNIMPVANTNTKNDE